MDIILLRPPVVPFLYSVFRVVTACRADHVKVLTLPDQSLVPLHQAGLGFDPVEYASAHDWVTALTEAMRGTTSDQVLILDPHLDMGQTDIMAMVEQCVSQPAVYVGDVKGRPLIQRPDSDVSMLCMVVSREVFSRVGFDGAFRDERWCAMDFVGRCRRLGVEVNWLRDTEISIIPSFAWQVTGHPQAEVALRRVDDYLLTWSQMTILRFCVGHLWVLIGNVLFFRVSEFRAIMKAVYRRAKQSWCILF
jgi:hypothetical protein